MAFAREVWNAQAYMAKQLYAGQILPTLKYWNPEMENNAKWTIPTIGSLTGETNAYGSSSSVTATDAGALNSYKELTTHNDAYKYFTLTQDEIDTTNINVVNAYIEQSNKAIFNAVETDVLLQMAIGSASGNRIEMASGNQITLANLQTMKQNLLDGGADANGDFYLAVDPEYLMNLQNVVVNSNKIFLDRNYLDQKVLETGVVGMIEGFKVVMTHNLPTLSDDGSAYDASGEKGLLYYCPESMAVGMTSTPTIKTDEVLTTVPVVNSVLVHYYYGKVVVNTALCGCIREYSA